MRHTVQNAPLHLKLLTWVYGILLAIPWYTISVIWRMTFQVERAGQENLNSAPNRIYCFWHENLPMYFGTHLRVSEKQIWMQHPLLFMKPIHIMLRMMGVKEFAYGSSGNDGKAALERVVSKLKDGYSTVITPDGPRGPVKELKAGPLIFSERSGVPIIPMTFSCNSYWIMNTWDKKIWPKPFSKVVITYHEPIMVTDTEDQEVWKNISDAMNR